MYEISDDELTDTCPEKWKLVNTGIITDSNIVS